ncbi:MAG TPA: hypothetical protein VGS07_17510 [Thermoanaerobaculia bacterium]|jgi:hypothetical protein|nr:hypothetical protein [Thermoanaerobaculia bacterium]
MLAKVPSNQAEAADLIPAPPSFTATLNLDATTFTDTFALTDENNDLVVNLVNITESTQQISITLVGATFSGEKIEWLLPPPGGALTPTQENNTISFTVPQPEHILAPWAFRFIGDDNTTGTKGIRSQTIFLTKPVGSEPESDEVKYDASTGTFTLPPSEATGPLPITLVNAGLPGASATFSVDLNVTGSVPDGTSITFAESPVVWSSGSAPDWVNAIRSSSNLQNMTLMVSSSGGGQAIGFRFAIEITAGESTSTVLSPDPIIINATIGDG